jgi:2-polyprenyl-3-methyl-5-hydroxy-6-metoxy-1,4-benzoquinol methylase
MNRAERRRQAKNRAKPPGPADLKARYQRPPAGSFTSAEAQHQQGLALFEAGVIDQAITALRNAARSDPQNDEYWGHWAASISNITFMAVDQWLFDDLLMMLDRPTVRPNDVSRAIISALRHHPDFASLLAGHGEDIGGTVQRLSRIPLLLRLMALSVLNHLDCESVLTALRRAMIQAEALGELALPGLPFSAALAQQCFINEYAYVETAEESAAVEALGHRLAGLLDEGDEIPPLSLATFAAYRPLHGVAWAEKLAGQPWPAPIAAVIRQQLTEPLEECSLGAGIACLTAIEDSVSRDVRGQYEENPYPRWIRTGLLDQTLSIAQCVQASTFSPGLTGYESPENPEILVAGCGTGQHALATATRFRNARVVAVDLSRTSLAYAQRKTREAGVGNIEYGQGDILALNDLGRQFDFIECAGVLHHMDDPLAGWRVLTDLLRPGGLMYIGLYSEAARRAVVKVREIIAGKQYQSSAADIRRCRHHIMTTVRSGDSDLEQIIKWRDFYSLSGCRDLLFHVREHRFTIPMIEEALAQLDLTFLGFALSDNLPALRRFRQTYGDGAALDSLASWHRFELDNPDAFTGMYQFWLQKSR